MIKQDIIKAREKLAARAVMQRGQDFAHSYRVIREVLTAMTGGQPDLTKYNIILPRYVVQKLRELGIVVLQLPTCAHFRLKTANEG